MPWTPPAMLLPIDGQIYALLRMYIDAGNLAVISYGKARDDGCEPIDKGGKGCWIDTKPPIAKLAAMLYQYIPVTAIPLAPAQAWADKYFPGDPTHYPDKDSDRLGWPTFVDRPALLKALDDATPPGVKNHLLGDLDRPPDAEGVLTQLPTANAADPSESMSWWVYALSAGGFLSWLGKSKVLALLGPGKKVKALLAIGAALLYALSAAGLVDAVIPEVKKVIKKTVLDPLAKGANIFAIGAGLAGVVLVSVLVIRSLNKPRPQKALAA